MFLRTMTKHRFPFFSTSRRCGAAILTLTAALALPLAVQAQQPGSGTPGGGTLPVGGITPPNAPPGLPGFGAFGPNFGTNGFNNGFTFGNPNFGASSPFNNSFGGGYDPRYTGFGTGSAMGTVNGFGFDPRYPGFGGNSSALTPNGFGFDPRYPGFGFGDARSFNVSNPNLRGPNGFAGPGTTDARGGINTNNVAADGTVGPNTGLSTNRSASRNFNANNPNFNANGLIPDGTGALLNPQTGEAFGPATGNSLGFTGRFFDPNTGQPLNQANAALFGNGVGGFGNSAFDSSGSALAGLAAAYYGGGGLYGLGLTEYDQNMIKYQNYMLNNARYNLDNAMASRAYAAANFFNVAAMDALRSNYKQNRALRAKYRLAVANIRDKVEEPSPATSSSTSAETVPVIDSTGTVLWPASAPLGGELEAKRKAAEAAILAAVQELQKNGRVSLPTIIAARDTLAAYGTPALTEVGRTNEKEAADLRMFFRRVFQTLETMALDPPKPGSATTGANAPETPKRAEEPASPRPLTPRTSPR